MADTITIRRSTADDAVALERLAALDSRRPPRGEALLAFVGGELRAALELQNGATVADPFARTSDVVRLLQVRAGKDERPARSILGTARGWKLRAA